MTGGVCSFLAGKNKQLQPADDSQSRSPAKFTAALQNLAFAKWAHAFCFAMALLKTAMKPAVMLVVFALFCAGGAAADKADLHRSGDDFRPSAMHIATV